MLLLTKDHHVKLKLGEFNLPQPDMGIVAAEFTNYRAPEMDLGNYSVRSVVWSLGVMLYEMHYGRRPTTNYLPSIVKPVNLFP